MLQKNETSTNHTILSISMPPEVLAILKRAARKSQRSVSGQVRHLVLETLEKGTKELANATA